MPYCSLIKTRLKQLGQLSGPNELQNPDPNHVQDQNPNQLGELGWRVEVNDELRDHLGRFLCA